MERIYIDFDMAQFTRKDLTLVDMKLFDGRSFENLEPRRLFPITGMEKYIALLDESGVEQAVIRDLSTLPAEQRKIIEECLAEYYLIPKILKITDVEERSDGITLYTVTERGPVNIEMRTWRQGFSLTQESRMLIRDANDNRYEIPDINKLDNVSRSILNRYT